MPTKNVGGCGGGGGPPHVNLGGSGGALVWVQVWDDQLFCGDGFWSLEFGFGPKVGHSE